MTAIEIGKRKAGDGYQEAGRDNQTVMSKRHTPLSARERNGLIALLTIGFVLIGGGFFVRQINTSRPESPNIILTGDSDSLELYPPDKAADTASPKRDAVKLQARDTAEIRKQSGPKTRKQETIGTRDRINTRATSPKRTQPAHSSPTPPPERDHLEETLN